MSAQAAGPMKVAFVSVVPSPYQRDFFRALAAREELDLNVFYLEKAAPDSPWPEKGLARYEKVLPGGWLSAGTARIHFNLPPALGECDFVVLNTLMSATAQWLMRVTLRRQRWIFWGERLNRGNSLHRFAASPLHRAAGIVGIGSWAADDYARRFPEPGHFNEPYSCDLGAYFAISRPRSRSDEFVFLFCGQMIERKGVDILLRAFDRVVRDFPSARLDLVGREAEVEGLLQTVPASTRERICYRGFQPPEALPDFFAMADAFVLPSRYDGWGVVVNQALAAGLPVICSDSVGAGVDFVKEGINGLKVESSNESALADAMRALAGDPIRAAAWGDRSRELADWLKPERSALRWIEIFRSLERAGRAR